jgi:hypothetical protein
MMAINFLDPLAALERSTSLTSSGLPYSFARKFSQYGLSPEREQPYMSPQEEQSALMELGQMGAHAIGTVGALLDVPGAMVRNALVGKSVLDPLAAPLTTAGRATGRDVLKQYGIMGDTDKSLPWYSPERLARGAVGIGAEVLLDPTTYLTFGLGSATKAGRALQALGKPAHRELAELMGVGLREAWTKGSLDTLLQHSEKAAKYTDLLTDFAAKNSTTLDALKTQRLGSAMGLHVPFTHLTAPIETPLDRLAPNVDALAQSMAVSPIGRGLQAIVNPRMMNTTSEAVQKVAPKVFDETLDLTADARAQVEPLLSAAYSRGWLNPVDISKATGADIKTTARHIADDLGNDMLHYIETNTPIDLAKYPHVNANDATEMKQLLDQYRTIAEESFKRDVDEYGIAMRELNKKDFFYAHRRVHHLPDDKFRFPGKRPFNVEKSYQRDRALFMRYLPTKMLNEISMDADFSGAASRFTTVPEEFYKKQGDLLAAKYGTQYAPTLKGEKVQWSSVARWAGDLDPRYAELRIPYYRTDPFETLTRRVEASAQARGAAEGVFKLMSTHAAKEIRGTAGPSRELVSSVFKDMPALGKNEEGVKQFAAMEKWMDRHFADARNADLRDQLMKEIGQDWKIKGDDITGTEKWAQSLSIPGDVARDMKRIMATFSEPEALQGFVKWYDTMLNRWKKWVTIPWPSFHTRNMWSGFARNMAAGHFDPRDYENAFRLMTANQMGKGVAQRYFGMNTLLKDEEAVAKLRNELFANRVVSHHAGMQDLASPIGGQLVDVPGVTHMMQPSMLMPDAPRWDRMTDPWIRFGGAGSYFVEGQNRIGAYLNMRAKGMSPSAAAEKVRALQVEYSPQFATEADRRVRRLLPFWTFHKNVVPWTIKSLIEHPGGVIAQTAKRTATMRSATPLLPENVQKTTAIEIPSDEPGGKKFISTLGFMEEPFYGTVAPLLQVPFSMAQAVGVPVKAGATPMQAGGEFVREILSQSNPFVKGLAEWAFGRSTYFGGGEAGGRELRSLTPPFGQLVSRVAGAAGYDLPVRPFGFGADPIMRPMEYFVGASPLSRFISTASGLLDPRKSILERAVNLGVGIKTTDVSAAQMAAQTNEALRNAMTAYGARTFIKPYFRPEDLASMDPVARRQADLLNNMSRWMSYKARQARD